MSVTAKDHRRFVDGKMTETVELKPAPLLEQAASDAANTGDPRLDKLIRVIAAELKKHDAHLVEVGEKCARSIEDSAVRLMQMEYAYTSGAKKAFETLTELAQRILKEEEGPTATA